jgi:Reverse transcriptase-like
MMMDSSIAFLIAVSSSIILLFDGSLRSPSDPGFSSTLLRRSGACSASITVEPHEMNDVKNSIMNLQFEKHPLLIGVKEIPVDSYTSSAEVEFESLYFGLKKLAEILHLQNNNLRIGLAITVQGDCKNVINQMRGLARPRKLEKYYVKCRTLMENQLSMHRFTFCHLPRVQNVVCDRLAFFAVAAQEHRAEKLLFDDIGIFEKLCKLTMDDESDFVHVNREVVQILRTHLSHGSLIPYSVRPPIYWYISLLCASIRDYESSLLVSATFQKEFDDVWTKTGDCIKMKYNSDQIQEEIASYQLSVYDALGMNEKIIRHKLKHKKSLNWDRIREMSNTQLELPNSHMKQVDSLIGCLKKKTLEQKLDIKLHQTSPAFRHTIKNLDQCIFSAREIEIWQNYSQKDV